MSDSPWNAPIVVVKKTNSNDLRICINYKKLNNVTIKPTYYIPDANQIFDSLHGAKYFSTLDLSSAYYQCGIKEEHKNTLHLPQDMGNMSSNVGLCLLGS